MVKRTFQKLREDGQNIDFHGANLLKIFFNQLTIWTGKPFWEKDSSVPILDTIKLN
jgi:hypothetical protein